MVAVAARERAVKEAEATAKAAEAEGAKREKEARRCGGGGVAQAGCSS